MSRLQSQLINLKEICFRWYYQTTKQEIVTPEGLRLSLASNDLLEESDDDKENKPQNQRSWVREEMVVLVSEYFRTKNLGSEESKNSVNMVSQILRNRALKSGEVVGPTFRNVSGIQMQTACLIKYDPEMQEKGINGLKGGSRLMENIVNEYLDNPDKIKAEAYETICKYIN